MKSSLLSALGLALLACGAESGGLDGDARTPQSGAAWSALTGAFVRPVAPVGEHLALVFLAQPDGVGHHYTATIAVRCAPRGVCESARETGMYTATRSGIVLQPDGGTARSYGYRREGAFLTLTRVGVGARETLSAAPSYCDSAADCDEQHAARPPCEDDSGAGWACDGSHRCAYRCAPQAPPAAGCSRDADCPEGQLCTRGACGIPLECSRDEDCLVTGCNGEVCANHQVLSNCAWHDGYACLRHASCGCVAGRCGFAPPTSLERERYDACVAVLGAP